MLAGQQVHGEHLLGPWPFSSASSCRLELCQGAPPGPQQPGQTRPRGCEKVAGHFRASPPEPLLQPQPLTTLCSFPQRGRHPNPTCSCSSLSESDSVALLVCEVGPEVKNPASHRWPHCNVPLSGGLEQTLVKLLWDSCLGLPQ